MELVVDKSAKKLITKQIIKCSKMLTFLKLFALCIFLLAIVSGCVHIVLAINSPSAYIVNVRGIPTKDTASIITNTVLFFAIGGFLSLIVRALLSNLSGKNVNEREDEVLIMMDDMVRYVFRTKNHSALSSRIVINIPYANVTSIEYCEDTKKVLLRGDFPCKYVEDYGTAKATEFEEVKFNEFTIHDYFVPSFFESISKRIDT